MKLRRLSIEPPLDDDQPLEARNDYWEHRVSLDNDDFAAQFGLCSVRFEQGRWDDLLAIVDRMQAQYPNISGFQRWRVMKLYDHDHDMTAAKTAMEIAFKENGDDIEVSARMVEMQAAAPDESLRHGQVAKSGGKVIVNGTSRKHARSLAALAAAHAEVGEFDDAVKVQQEALLIATEKERQEWEPRLNEYQSHRPFRLPSARAQ
jgi:tetratricopeptide (TPR) repeat protein